MSKAPVLVISHAQCTDGATAAAIVELAMEKQGRRVEHRPEGYGYKRLPDVKDREVCIVDFCYLREEMEVLDSQCARLTVLDHHASAEKAMTGFRCRCGEVHFDMKESGASLAWRHFFPNEDVPALVEHVKDFDLWQWKLEHTEAVISYLEVEGNDNIQLLKGILKEGRGALKDIYVKGSHFVQQKRKLVEEIASDAVEMNFLGYKTLKASTPRSLSSFVGGELAKRTGSFGIAYRQCADGSIKLGLRSLPEFSLLDLAEKLGGGGHPNSCGAILKDPALISAFLDGDLRI